MPLAHYYDVDREHSTKYTSSHCLLKNREAGEWYRLQTTINFTLWSHLAQTSP